MIAADEKERDLWSVDDGGGDEMGLGSSKSLRFPISEAQLLSLFRDENEDFKVFFFHCPNHSYSKKEFHFFPY